MGSVDPGQSDSVWIAAPDGRRITIRPFPDEPGFMADIRRLAIAVGPSAATEAELRDLLETALRARYPRLVIRARDSLATLAGDDQVWYVLRDGRVGRPNERLSRLHPSPADARRSWEARDNVVQRAAPGFALAKRPGDRQDPGQGG